MQTDGQPDRVVGRYREFEILAEIGAGSFARVYKVLAPGHKRPLALKLAVNTRLTTDALKRAVREIAVLRSLTNPHVARLHGSSVGHDHFYVLMDYLEGQQLDRHHSMDEPMGLGEALSILLQVCMGLVEAHAQGVVHRDIKPANIWIEPNGNVRILDFGLARAWGVPWAFGANATAAQTVVGTPHYCQPEQLLTDQLTPASDVYSLGTILYELLCGHSPLFADRKVSRVVAELAENPIAWLEAHATRPVVPITRYPGCAGLPDTLLELLTASLAKAPDERPANAGVLACTLGQILYEDLGALEAAEVRIVEGPGVGGEPQVLVPGRRRLGRSPEADVRLPGDGVAPFHALIDWSGSPRPIQIRPEGAASLLHNGEPLRRVAEVTPGDVFTAGETHFVVVPPRTRER